MRGPCTYRRRDLRAAVETVEKMGKTVHGVEIAKDGTIRVIVTALEPVAAAPTKWDKWLSRS